MGGHSGLVQRCGPHGAPLPCADCAAAAQRQRDEEARKKDEEE